MNSSQHYRCEREGSWFASTPKEKLLKAVMTIAIVVILFAGVAVLYGLTTGKIQTHPECLGLSDVTEVGWLPIIGSVTEETDSGITYITVSLSGNPNDFNLWRKCLVHPLENRSISETNSWLRFNEKTRVFEAYVVSERANKSYSSQRLYYAMRNPKERGK